MLPEERLNDLAEREIAALEAEGIRLTAAEVVKLNALGWAVENPTTRRRLARGVPVAVGGVSLWPLTLYASDWLERASGHFNGNADVLAVAYAMAHSYAQNGELDGDGPEVVDIVKAWSKKLLATPQELTEAVEQVMAQDATVDLPASPADGKPMETGDFSAFLAATNGGDPEFWERRCSIGYALAVLAHITRQNAADGKPTANDPKILATRAFGIAAEQIRELAKAQENG
jgi:hypothetical protein